MEALAACPVGAAGAARAVAWQAEALALGAGVAGFLRLIAFACTIFGSVLREDRRYMNMTALRRWSPYVYTGMRILEDTCTGQSAQRALVKYFWQYR